jgi:SagB-type dehydrogenase family enzyme
MRKEILTTMFIVLFISGFSAQGQEKTQPETGRPAVTPLRKLQLPEPKLTGSVSLEQAMAVRRSVRQFTSQELNLEQVGQLAWAGQGITQKERGYRTAPSAGALYPIRLYFIIKGGMYVYEPNDHSLEKLLNLDLRHAVSQAALRQQAPAKAACDILIAGSVKKVAARYGLRARQYMLLEAGHIAQNIHLQAVSLGLASVPIGAFDDKKVEKICRLPSDQEAIYLIAVGYPAAGIAIPAKTIEQQKPAVQPQDRKAKKALMIIAEEKFLGKEFFDVQDILGVAGIETIVASWRLGQLTSDKGGKTEATVLVGDVDIDDYDAVVILGAEELKRYTKDTAVLNIVRESLEKGKVLAAIDWGPRILAEAGVLRGVLATSAARHRRRLLDADAKYTGADAERDGLIVTGYNSRSTGSFSRVLAEAILGLEPVPKDGTDLGRYVPRRVQKRREEYQVEAPKAE